MPSCFAHFPTAMQTVWRNTTGKNPGLADADSRRSISMNPVQDLMVAPVRNEVLLLFGAMACVLLIACANLASLLLSRSVARRKEIAIRTALDATRSGLVRQLLTESLFLALMSGALGVALSGSPPVCPPIPF